MRLRQPALGAEGSLFSKVCRVQVSAQVENATFDLGVCSAMVVEAKPGKRGWWPWRPFSTYTLGKEFTVESVTGQSRGGISDEAGVILSVSSITMIRYGRRAVLFI